jgi:flagella basal body P-ring formation protein FlgA
VLAAGSLSDVVELSVQDVRKTLDEAGVHWGRINLSGRRVTIRPGRSADAAAPMAMTGVSLEAPKAERPTSPDRLTAAQPADTLIALSTLRGSIANLLITKLNVKPAELRLAFQRADEALLDSTDPAVRYEIQPLGDAVSDRIDLQIRAWTDGRVQQRHFVSVVPTVRRQVATLTRDIAKNQTITEADLELSEQWLPAGQAAMTSDKVQAVGRVTSVNLKAGDVIRDQNIRRESLIKRGDKVVVRCLVGGVAIAVQAEAREDGADGQTIEFRKQGEKQTFLATVTSRGEAVVDLSHK